MKSFLHSDLALLRAAEVAPCLSIYMPTTRHHPETEQNPIRFKNLLKQVEHKLGALSDATSMRTTLDQLTALPGLGFWRAPSDGLAVFASASTLSHFRVPIVVPERVVVSDSFHIRPMLQLLATNRRYGVLALSMNRVHLYQGTQATLFAMEGTGLPESASEVLGEPEHPPENRSQRSTGGGPGTSVHGGWNSESGFRRDQAVRFFRLLDRSLLAALRDDPLPVVIAASQPYRDLYRELSRYPNLLATGVDGSFDHSPATELHARSWTVAQEHFRAVEDQRIGEVDRAISSRLASTEVSTIARATVEGRVRLLLMAKGRELRGSIDPVNGIVTAHPDESSIGYDDVYDDLAEMVLARRGEVLIVEPERLPTGAPIAAHFRW